MRILKYLTLILLLANHAFAQRIAEDLPELPFLRMDSNRIEFKGDSSNFMQLFRKLDSMILYGKGKVNIVHMGGSHIQAGVLSSQFAKRLQSFYPGLEGSRGFVFPYRIARTNNPRSYKTEYSGKWTYCKCTNKRKKSETLGLSGISATTYSASASFTISPRPKNGFPNYSFNRIRVFHAAGNDQFKLVFPPQLKIKSKKTDVEKGVTEVFLSAPADKLSLSLKETDAQQQSFTLYGIYLENDDPGFTYFPIGVNGTTIPSYLRCQLFVEHLSALRPDWVILTLGTNDAYGRRFYPERFKAHYKELLANIKKAAPNAVILLTVPNDSYLYRRYPNQNTAKTAQVIRELSKELGVAMWNFYEIMGGLNSVRVWEQNRLARRDKIHFTGEGYVLQADLLFAAFVKSYEDYLRNLPSK